MSFLERIARRALGVDEGIPRAVTKDLALRPGFIPPPDAPATTPDPRAAAPAVDLGPNAGHGEAAAGDAPRPSPAPPASVARQTGPPPAGEEEEPAEEEPPARMLRAQRQVADEAPEDEEERARPLRRQPVNEPEPEPEEEPDELQPLRRRTVPDAGRQPLPGLQPPVHPAPGRSTGPSGAEPSGDPVRPSAPTGEQAAPDRPVGPAAPAASEAGEPGPQAAAGSLPGDASAPPVTSEPPSEEAGFEIPAAEPARPDGDRRPPPPPWPLAAPPPEATPGRPDVVIEQIDVVVAEPAPAGSPAPPAPPFRRAIAARYLRGL